MANIVESYVIFGKLLTSDEVDIDKKQRSCNHQVSDASFCDKCGKPMWVEKRVTIFSELLVPIKSMSLSSKELSYFYNNFDERSKVRNVVVGFCLNHSELGNFKEVSKPTVGMIEDIRRFCEKTYLDFKEDDVKMYSISY